MVTDSEDYFRAAREFYRTFRTPYLMSLRRLLRTDLTTLERRPRENTVAIAHLRRRLQVLDQVLASKGITEE